jgi:hypothetical protein
MANAANPKKAREDGQTDQSRGNSVNFPFSKAGRKTGMVGKPSTVPNQNTEDGNKRVANDPRLA